MLSKLLKKSEINKILVISLSNIGDVVLTFPVLDVLREEFPSAKLSVVVGPKAISLLKGNPHLDQVYCFDKHQAAFQLFRWALDLRKEKFDLVVDLRHTAIPILLSPKYRTPFNRIKTDQEHMKYRHLARLCSVVPFVSEPQKKLALYLSEKDKQSVNDLLRSHVGSQARFVVVGPGAANHIKRWHREGFAKVCDSLSHNERLRIVFVGDDNDQPTIEAITQRMESSFLNLAGKTNLSQLAALLQKASLVIVNDSAIMHLASYLNVSVVAIFGPTDPKKYGPWSSRSVVVRKDIFCSPCQKSGCAYHHECMSDISDKDVLNILRKEDSKSILRSS